MTAVEWLYDKIKHGITKKQFDEFILEAKEMEKKQSHEYAEFAIRCDRMDMKILNFKDYLKLEK